MTSPACTILPSSSSYKEAYEAVLGGMVGEYQIEEEQTQENQTDSEEQLEYFSIHP